MELLRYPILLDIKTILESEFQRGGEGLEPSHIILGDKKIYSVVISGIIIDKYESPKGNYVSFIVNDKDSSIRVKFFDDLEYVNKIKLGEFVRVLGNIKEDERERYLLGKVISIIDVYGFLRDNYVRL